MTTVQKAIDNYGTRYKFAKEMGVSWDTVNAWCKNDAIPVERCIQASKLLGVPAAKLNAAVAKVFA